jgi:protein-disulfide isomerase
MSEEITIKKQDLWKYATFALIAIVLIGSVFFFTGNSSSGNNNAGTGAGTGQATISMDAFEKDTSLYPSLGPEDADTVVIEFSDFQCPYCTMASGLASWTSQYQAQYGDLIGAAGNLQEMAARGEIRFIYVSMSFLGAESVYASEAGLCANEQGKFWEMHDAIFGASTGPTENDGKYTKENLKTLASGISGLDKAKFNKCLDDGKYTSSVQKIGQAAGAAGVSGTPTFVVNGQKVPSSWSAIQGYL